MRRFVVAVFAVVLALTLGACGGGGGEEETAAPDAAAPVAPAPAPGGAAVTAAMDRSAISTETFEPFRTLDGTMPAGVVQRLKTKQAMLLFFYNAAQRQTDDYRDQIDAVMEEYRGDIDLLTYDLGRYTSVEASGAVDVNTEALDKSPQGKEAVKFAREVGVDHVPYVIIVDDQGYKIFWARGFIDAKLLERQILRAVR